MGSIGGLLSLPFLGPYCASKFALEALTDALRMELYPWGIPVSILEPGNISTPIWDKAVAEKKWRSGNPVERVVGAVEHALTAKRPKTRYLVGGDARVQASVAKHVPDWTRDQLILAEVRLPRKPV